MLCFPAVLFSGAILPVHLMAGAGAALSVVIPSRWAFEAIGHDLGARRILAEGGSRLGPPLLASYGDAGTASTGTYWLDPRRVRGRVPGRHVGRARAQHTAIDALNAFEPPRRLVGLRYAGCSPCAVRSRWASVWSRFQAMVAFFCTSGRNSQ